MIMRAWFAVLLPLLLVLFLCACSNDENAGTKSETASEQEAVMEPLQIVMLGPPGAGKGTQSRKIEEKFSIPHISTGEILRAEVERKTKLGKEIEDVMMSGELVADDIIIRLVEARLIEPDCRRGFILDGFPRTITQAKELDAFLRRQGRDKLHVIYLMVTEKISLERLMARRRLDDTEEILKNRIKVYHEQTAPLIDYYFEKGLIVRVNGVQSIDDVFQEIEERLAGLGWK
jgi:adenylate kinase